METIHYKNIDFTAWDVGGRDKIRPLYRHYFANTQALIYVIDSNDRERVKSAGEELASMLREDELRDAVLVVLANKQDLENAMSVDEVSKAIEFDGIRLRKKTIVGTCATSGEGLHEAFEWIAKAISGDDDNDDKEIVSIKPVQETIEDTKALAKVIHSSTLVSISQLIKYLTRSTS